MTEPGFAVGFCRHCKTKVKAALHLCINQNGSSKYTWVCPSCGVHGCFCNGKPDGPQMFIGHEIIQTKLTQPQIDALPVLMFDPCYRCVRCGKRESELHHWAPLEIFGKESNDWPKDYLCPDCHALWHARLNAWKAGKK